MSALLSGAGFGGIDCAKVDEPMLIGRDVDDVLEYERASPTATEILTGLSPAEAAELNRHVSRRPTGPPTWPRSSAASRKGPRGDVTAAPGLAAQPTVQARAAGSSITTSTRRFPLEAPDPIVSLAP